MTSLTKSNPTQVDNDIVDANMPYLGSDTGSKSHGIYQMDSVGRIENMASSNGINIMKNYVIQAQIAILLFLVHVTIITQIIIFPT
ncbi:hypothetical protein DPMN_038257 [Dreissena polymorpha]|uniref:Uncharacterized protein n=2 Tax=Dreissena polymorpha TaxID=45954 RepID=A0A9D4MF39_DREPO|nr:hypothetical protein DPMN_038257 [Dreissena polymorpha]